LALHQPEAVVAVVVTADKTVALAALVAELVVKDNQTQAVQVLLDKVFQEVEKAMSATVTAVAAAAKAALAATQEQVVLVNQEMAASAEIFQHILEQVMEKVVILQAEEQAQ
jgi:Trk-type K+ transport system membrane component